MTVKELALAVADALDDPKTWTAGYFARDEHGYITEYDSDRAVCWCAVGHAFRMADDITVAELRHAFRERIGIGLSRSNDETDSNLRRIGREPTQRRLRKLAEELS
jgi:hypothetical protein